LLTSILYGKKSPTQTKLFPINALDPNVNLKMENVPFPLFRIQEYLKLS